MTFTRRGAPGRWDRGTLLGVALALSGALAPAAVAEPGNGEGDEATRARMEEIFDAIRDVLPLSLSDARFAAPENRERILAALEKLAAGASRLEDHGRSRDAGFAFLSGSLARDARDIHARYASGRTDEARFLLHYVTDNCVACHSRLPTAADSSLSRRFVRDADVASLPLPERAHLEAATRQFDRALESFEALLTSDAFAAADADLMGHVDEYLELCIRVRQDLPRARRTLVAFGKRDDVSPALRENLEHWIASLARLEERGIGSGPDEARALLEVAGDESRFEGDRAGLVYYVAASSALHPWVTAEGRSAAEAAEGYYLLGLIESRVGRSFWLSQTESFLEAAIRLAPGEPVARSAYDLLEDFVTAGYSGSSGVHVPADVRRRLESLRELVEEARPPPSSSNHRSHQPSTSSRASTPRSWPRSS